MSGVEQTKAAISATKTYAAERAVDDPVKLAKAARIIRAALARRRLSVADLAGVPIDAPLPDREAA